MALRDMPSAMPSTQDLAAIRLILTDIDGTILPFGATSVSARCRQAFHAAMDADIAVGPASAGRFLHIPASFAGDAACSATCLATNGMQVFLRGELIHQELLPPQPVAQMAKLLEHVPHAGLIYFEQGVPYLVCGKRADLERGFALYAAQSVDAPCVPDHGLEKANVFVDGDLDATREVLEYLAAEVSGVGLNLPMAGFINVTPVGWSKANGIDVLAEALGIGLDQVAVFGDGGNDVEMLAHVACSFAVAGAVPAAAAAARYRIGAVEDDAVAQVIERIVASAGGR